ncbi:mercury resistance system transport protein MerF [Kiloniella sp.]|uniref:mercury resistance system transport protein MerF n=1 Tax=Kiloniella sp. TaxID=1938587 RepID=UPI003B017DBC
MSKNRILKIGVIGSVITAICCVTPILVVLFGVLGVGAAVSYLDIILIPMLAVFLGIAGYGYWRVKWQ